jgi:hypothetical protein
MAKGLLCRLCADRCPKPLPVRLLRRPGERVHLTAWPKYHSGAQPAAPDFDLRRPPAHAHQGDRRARPLSSLPCLASPALLEYNVDSQL